MPFAAADSCRYASSELRRRTHVVRKKIARNVSIASEGDVVELSPRLFEVDVRSSSSWPNDDHCQQQLKHNTGQAPTEPAVDPTLIGDEKKIREINNVDKDHDSESVFSIDSFLSVRSSDTSKDGSLSQVDKEACDMKQLQHDLECRGTFLSRLKTSHPIYSYKILETHEIAAQAVKLERYRAKNILKQGPQSQDANNRGRITYSSDPRGRMSHEGNPHPVLYAWWWVLFELTYTAPAAFKMVVVCLCHLFFFGVLDTLSRILYHSLFVATIRQEFFSLFQIFLGLCLLRVNGSLWTNLDADTYNIVKFDMHNRRHLGFTDAKLLSFFKSSCYGSAGNLFGFYLVYMGSSQIYSRQFIFILRFLETWYLQKKETIIQDQNLQEEDLHFYSFYGNNAVYSEDVSNTCKFVVQHVHPSVQWWFSYCCNDPSQEWKALDMMLYTMGLLVVTVIAATVGINILEICDDV
jgi:hypothetical protein